MAFQENGQSTLFFLRSKHLLWQKEIYNNQWGNWTTIKNSTLDPLNTHKKNVIQSRVRKVHTMPFIHFIPPLASALPSARAPRANRKEYRPF